jgi:hypothetical protein
LLRKRKKKREREREEKEIKDFEIHVLSLLLNSHRIYTDKKNTSAKPKITFLGSPYEWIMTMSSSLAELSYVKRREVMLNVLTTSLHPQREIKQNKVYWRIFLLWRPATLAKRTKVKSLSFARTF